jgi:hypothetical protein
MTDADPAPAPAPVADPAPAPAADPKPDPAPDPKAAPKPDPAPAPKDPAGNPAADPKPEPAGDWAADWREKLAGADKDDLKTLTRLGSPADLWKQNKELRRKLSSGELKKTLPEGATAEEKAAWRAENGLPDKPEVYVEKLALPDGVVIGAADKPVVAEFAKAAFDGNVPPAAFSGLVAKYYELQDAQKAQQADDDARYHDENVAALGKEFGANTRREINMVNSFVGQYFPKEISADLLVARTPDGRMLGDNPVFVKALAALSREVSPLSALVPAGAGDAGKLAADRIAEIKGWMGAPSGSPDHKKYWGDEKVRAEYRDLVDAQAKMKARNG